MIAHLAGSMEATRAALSMRDGDTYVSGVTSANAQTTLEPDPAFRVYTPWLVSTRQKLWRSGPELLSALFNPKKQYSRVYRSQGTVLRATPYGTESPAGSVTGEKPRGAFASDQSGATLASKARVTHANAMHHALATRRYTIRSIQAKRRTLLRVFLARNKRKEAAKSYLTPPLARLRARTQPRACFCAGWRLDTGHRSRRGRPLQPQHRCEHAPLALSQSPSWIRLGDPCPQLRSRKAMRTTKH